LIFSVDYSYWTNLVKQRQRNQTSAFVLQGSCHKLEREKPCEYVIIVVGFMGFSMYIITLNIYQVIRSFLLSKILF
jgi:hypothetical protein